MKCKKSKCIICEESFPQEGLAFFKFPKEESRFKKWVKEIWPLIDNLKLNPFNLKENGRICANHFKEKDFINFKKNSLVRNACPTIDISDLNKKLLDESVCNDDTYSEKQSFQKYDPIVNNLEKDTFQCGRCKTQYQQLYDFIDHKRSQCKSPDIILTRNILEKTVFQNGQISTLNTVSNSSGSKFMKDERIIKAEDCLVEVAAKELPKQNEMVSFIMNDNTLLVGTSISGYSGQIIFTPKESETESASILVNTSEHKLSSNGGYCKNIFLSSNECNNDSELLFTCPVQHSLPPNDLVFAQVFDDDVKHVVLTEPENKLSENYSLDNSVNLCEINESVGASHVDQNLLKIVCEQLPAQNQNVCTLGLERIDLKSSQIKANLTCIYCGKTFRKPFNLQQHERVHTGERPFQCIICGRAFSQKSNVRKHMIRHKVWPQAKQTLKMKVDQSQQSISQEVLDQMSYSCQYCSSSFKAYALYKKHLSIHSNFKVYRCIQKGCAETFSDLDDFLSHSKVHSSAEFQCHICLKSFKSLEDLGSHQYDHDTTKIDKKEIEIKLKCEVCHAQFKTIESLRNHLAVDTHNYECVHCKSIFSSERFLRRHLAIHVDPANSKFKCPNCKKAFRTQKYLNNHIFIHSNDKPFNCEHCNKQFASKYRLKRHLAIHLNQYFECPFKAYLGCNKTFYRKDKLRDHVSTHGNCRLRRCPTCSKTFSSILKMNQHIKKEHKTGKGKQILKCTSCCQTFRKHKQLMQHYCTVGERKFKSRTRNPTSGALNGTETVSNIEIIMVPCDTEFSRGNNTESLA